MDEFPYAEAKDRAEAVCNLKRGLVAGSGLTLDEAVGELVSFIWEQWKNGRYDSSRSEFRMWAAKKANCRLIDMVRAECGDKRRPNGSGGRKGREESIKNHLKNQAQPVAIKINSPRFSIADGPPRHLRPPGRGRLGYDLRPLGRAIQHRAAVGCSWRALRDQLREDRDFARTLGFREVPGLATFWRLKRRLAEAAPVRGCRGHRERPRIDSSYHQ